MPRGLGLFAGAWRQLPHISLADPSGAWQIQSRMRPRVNSAQGRSDRPGGSSLPRRWALCGAAVTVAGATWLLTRSPERAAPARSAIPTAPRREARSLRARPALERRDDAEREAPPRTVRGEGPSKRENESAAPWDASLEPTEAEPSEVVATALPKPGAPIVPRGEAGSVFVHPARAEPPSDVLMEQVDTVEPPAAREPAPRRHVEIAAFQAWQQPGLCSEQQAASEAHGRLMRLFRVLQREDGSRIFLDPRLQEGAHLPLLTYLAEAEQQARAALGLSTGSAEVFAYQDRELLLAAACANDDVVAYYDGALHVVVTRDDLRQSVIHEYTHHALMTNGVLGPTWAQEGIAMQVASENWWLSEHWLGRVSDRPFSMDVMERAIPYTLSSEQAVLFYVQAAAMVACAAREEPDGLAGLAAALGAAHSKSQVSYDLAVPASPSELRVCLRTLLAAPEGTDHRR